MCARLRSRHLRYRNDFCPFRQTKKTDHKPGNKQINRKFNCFLFLNFIPVFFPCALANIDEIRIIKCFLAFLFCMLHNAREIQRTMGIQWLKDMFNREIGDKGRWVSWALILSVCRIRKWFVRYQESQAIHCYDRVCSFEPGH